ncbi:hypothetical protein STANM309S_00209 [Streptomyces tanashiensis]
MISGSFGAPDAAASARTILSTAVRTRSRTAGAVERMLIRRSAESGMMFSLVPACSEPTVTTAVWAAPVSRETIVCRRMTTAAAMTTGSMVDSGVEPCPPRPKSRTRRLSEAAITGPGRVPTNPAGAGATCWPRQMSARGKRSRKPSSIIAGAPPTSSAGWNTATTVPRHSPRTPASWAVAPRDR